MARKTTEPRMSDEDRRFIYRTLKKKFDFDEDYPLASLGWCFVREGIDREDYGFLKLKPMLEEMADFVSMSTKEIGGVSQSMFSLHEFAPYESDEDASVQEEKPADDEGAQEDASAQDGDASGDESVSEKEDESFMDADSKKSEGSKKARRTKKEDSSTKKDDAKKEYGSHGDEDLQKESSSKNNLKDKEETSIPKNRKDKKEVKSNKKSNSQKDTNEMNGENEAPESPMGEENASHAEGSAVDGGNADGLDADSQGADDRASDRQKVDGSDADGRGSRTCSAVVTAADSRDAHAGEAQATGDVDEQGERDAQKKSPRTRGRRTRAKAADAQAAADADQAGAAADKAEDAADSAVDAQPHDGASVAGEKPRAKGGRARSRGGEAASRGDASALERVEDASDSAESAASTAKPATGRRRAAARRDEAAEEASREASRAKKRESAASTDAPERPETAAKRPRAALPSPSKNAEAAADANRKAFAPEASSRKRSAADADAPSRRRSPRSEARKDQAPSASGRRPRRRVIPGKALERFGYLGTWQEFLTTLADLALDEPWDFNDAGLDVRTRRFDILHNYIRYTFYRLTLEDKVGFSADEDFAVFNTGLVDRHYEDIYACFGPSDPDKAEEARYAWSFQGFCTAGTGRLGKRLVRELSPLPQPASYLERKEDLLFDLDRELVPDVHHIVVDNVHRLPMGFLRDELAASPACLGILAGIEELPDDARKERFDRLREVIEGDTRLFNRISTSINAAIDVAKRQVRWNYKTAVPAYYPRTNSMNLLLPLILTDSPTPDVALVVELQKSGNYQGQTIVTMAQAYRDARLLCRPYIDWLSPASIIDAAEEEDEEE